MTNSLVAILVGVLTLVIGLTLGPVVLQSIADADPAVSASGRDFAGASSVNRLIPVVYFSVIVAIGIGMIGAGALGTMGRGLLANQR